MRLRRGLILLISAAVLAADEREKQVDALFVDYAKPGAPGCAVGVLERGATALAKGYGLADLETGRALTPASRFYMASVSKQFTSLSLLLAERDGKLRLDDPIGKYVPELPAYAAGIPIRRLLDHTAGLRDYLVLWGLRGFSNESVLGKQASLDLISRQRALNFPTGMDYDYSNSGYLLAAVALERATGKPLETFAQERIFQPLEMAASRFQADHSVPIPDRAHGYSGRTGAWKTADVGFDVVGSGGMYSNIEDMLRWARNYERPSVGEGLLGALQKPGKLLDGRPTPGGYALGMIERDGTYSHSGGAIGYSTYFLRIPAAGVTVVCLCNRGAAPVAKLAEGVAAIYTGAPIPARPAAPAKSAAAPRTWQTGEMARLAGSYWSEELFAVWHLRQRNGKLWLDFDGPSREVVPVDEATYRSGDFELIWKNGVLQASSGRATVTFTRR